MTTPAAPLPSQYHYEPQTAAGLLTRGALEAPPAGNLPAMLFNLGRHLELVTRLRRVLWRTFSYPLGVLLVLGAILVFISIMILPQMESIYSDFHTTLPALTEMLLYIGPAIP